VATSSPHHLAVLESVKRQEIRLAHFIWIVLPLELAFLTPWWVIGSRVHHRTFTDPSSWETVWLPIVGMLALLAWSVRLRGRARAELKSIERLREQYSSPKNGGENEPHVCDACRDRRRVRYCTRVGADTGERQGRDAIRAVLRGQVGL